MKDVSVGDTVLPGDRLKDIKLDDEKETVILGPGLRREDNEVFVCKAGFLKKREPSAYYVDGMQRRYVPNRGDIVVGIVTQKSGDIYKVDIAASEQATLSYLAFEGATKKNRPDIQVGDVVFAKLLVASKDMEPELVCMDSQGKENELGVLDSDGMVFSCSLNLVRKLLNPEYPLFKMIGRNQVYEVAAGMNEFGGMCVGIMGFHSSGSSPMIGFRRYSAVKSMIGYPPVPATSQRMLANIVDGLTHTLCKAGGGAAEHKHRYTEVPLLFYFYV